MRQVFSRALWEKIRQGPDGKSVKINLNCIQKILCYNTDTFENSKEQFPKIQQIS